MVAMRERSPLGRRLLIFLYQKPTTFTHWFIINIETLLPLEPLVYGSKHDVASLCDELSEITASMDPCNISNCFSESSHVF